MSDHSIFVLGNMKLIFLFSWAIVSITSGELFDGRFVVPVDHFRPQDGRVVPFHYNVNLEFYEEGGPMIFFLTAYGRFSTEYIEAGLMYDLAMELGGALFTTDPRYYRRNLLTETASLDDLNYLTIDQNIADIATFIHTARDHLDNRSGKVFVFGAGMGGTFAVLARQKYPHLIDAAWASNGWFRRDVFTTGYVCLQLNADDHCLIVNGDVNRVYDTIANNIRQFGSDECGDRVTEAFRQIDQLVASGDDETLVEEFAICRPFNISSRMDVAMLFEGVIDQFSSQFQYNQHPRVTSFCESMSVIPADPMRSLSRWIRFHYNADVGTCQDYDYEGRIQMTSGTEWNTPGTESGIRQWLYINCAIIGNLRTNTNGGMFGNRITEEYRQRLCMDTFGDGFNFDELYRTVERLNVAHGGQNPGVSRVFYTNGHMDMWISAAVTYAYEDDAHVVNIPGYARYGDLRSLSTLDSIVLNNAKTDLLNAFRRWNSD